MSFRLSTYLALAMAVGATTLLPVSTSLSVAYAAVCVALLAPYYILRVPVRYRYLLIAVAGTLWVTHVVRAPLMATMPQLFTYPRVGLPGHGMVLKTLFGVAINGCLLLTGLIIGVRVFSRPRSYVRAERPMGSLLVGGRHVIIFLLLANLGFQAYLQFGLHLAWKEIEPDPTTAFLVQLVPIPLIYGIAVLYLFEWRRQFSVITVAVTLSIVLGMIGMELLSGSRGFLLKAGIPLVAYILIRGGDRRLRMRTAIVAGTTGLCVLLLSFALVNSLRGDSNVESRLSGAGSAVMKGFREAFEPGNLLYWTSLVTERLNGFDGYTVSLMSRPPELVEVFSPEATLRRVISNLLPRVQLYEGVSSGKAIGMYYTGHSLEVKHAGALGLFGSAVVSLGSRWSLLAVFLFGILFGLLGRLAERIRDPGFRFLAQYIVLLTIVDCITSGNMDLVVSRFAINVAQLSAAFAGLWFLWYASGGHTRLRGRGNGGGKATPRGAVMPQHVPDASGKRQPSATLDFRHPSLTRQAPVP